jgi:hypothetical protein
MLVTIFNGHLVQIYRISNENKRLVIGAQTKECNKWIIAVIILIKDDIDFCSFVVS